MTNSETHELCHLTVAGPLQQLFKALALQATKTFHQIRGLIFDVAKDHTDGVGRLEETLKWGEPSYLTIGH